MVMASTVWQDFQQQGLITRQLGPDASFDRVQPVEQCGPTDLVFVDRAAFIPVVLERKPAVVVTSEPLAADLVAQGLCVLTSGNVKLAHALIRQKYTDTDFAATEWPRIDPSAHIHASVTPPQSCVIGPNVVVGERVQLGERCVVMANSVLEHDAVIGDDTVIHPNVVVGWGCQIGARVFLKSGCIIGAEGFGFAQDEHHKSHRIPQQGIVVIEADCLIGANSCVDRATFGETHIGTGVKVDNLVHIAHNVRVGQDCILVAQTGIAGSTTLGERVIASGQTGILDHLTIADDVVLLHRAGVTQDVLESGKYASLPLQPLKDYTKNMVLIKKLTEMNKKIRRLEKNLEKLSEAESISA